VKSSAITFRASMTVNPMVAVCVDNAVQSVIADRFHPDATISCYRRHKQRKDRAGAHQPRHTGHDFPVGGKQAAQQRAPWEVHGDEVRHTAQLRREGFHRCPTNRAFGTPPRFGLAAARRAASTIAAALASTPITNRSGSAAAVASTYLPSPVPKSIVTAVCGASASCS
jgi:hypothetical protein